MPIGFFWHKKGVKHPLPKKSNWLFLLKISPVLFCFFFAEKCKGFGLCRKRKFLYFAEKFIGHAFLVEIEKVLVLPKKHAFGFFFYIKVFSNILILFFSLEFFFAKSFFIFKKNYLIC